MKTFRRIPWPSYVQAFALIALLWLASLYVAVTQLQSSSSSAPSSSLLLRQRTVADGTDWRAPSAMAHALACNYTPPPLRQASAATQGHGAALTEFLAARAADSRRLEPTLKRICLVVYEIEGPILAGGIGTAYGALARALAADGHRVTVLLNRDDPVAPESALSWEQWQEEFARASVQLERAPLLLGVAKLKGVCGFTCTRSYVAYQWLRAQREPFDVVHFHDNAGFGYFSALAKRQGRAFVRTLLVLGMHGPHFWERRANRIYITEDYNLECDYLERRSAAWADFVVAPSAFIVHWAHARDWRLPPTRTFVLQNVMPGAVNESDARQNRYFHDARVQSLQELDEDSEAAPGDGMRQIAFFGRLETRKGVKIFLDAAAAIGDELRARRVRLLLLGGASVVDGKDSHEFIAEHCDRARLTCVMLTDHSRQQAMARLQRPRTLTVMASLTENSPYTVLECLGARLPFLASDVGGIPELVAPDDRARTLFRPTPAALAAALLRALRDADAAELRAPRFATPPDATRARWLALHRAWHATADSAWQASFAGGDAAPPAAVVSLCLVHRDNASDLRASLDALATATALDVVREVLVVDGSRDAAARAAAKRALEEVAATTTTTTTTTWSFIEVDADDDDTRSIGALRNRCALTHATARYVLFMDTGDRVERRDALSDMVRVAERTGAGVVSGAQRLVTHAGVMRFNRSHELTTVHVPIGCDADGLGALVNCYGYDNALLRRAAVARAGGFAADELGTDGDIWPLLAALALDGARVETLGDVLFWRASPTASAARPYAADEFAQRRRVARVFSRVLHPATRHLAAFAVDLYAQFAAITSKHKRYYQDRFMKKVQRVKELEAALAAAAAAAAALPKDGRSGGGGAGGGGGVDGSAPLV